MKGRPLKSLLPHGLLWLMIKIPQSCGHLSLLLWVLLKVMLWSWRGKYTLLWQPPVLCRVRLGLVVSLPTFLAKMGLCPPICWNVWPNAFLEHTSLFWWGCWELGLFAPRQAPGNSWSSSWGSINMFDRWVSGWMNGCESEWLSVTIYPLSVPSPKLLLSPERDFRDFNRTVEISCRLS